MESIATNSFLGVLASGVVFGGSVFALFRTVEDQLRPEKKRQLTVWLKGLDVEGPFAAWPLGFALMFDRIFAERDAGLVFDAKNLSVGDYLDRWLDTIRGTLAPNTVRRYGELTRIHIKPALGKAKLSKLDPLRRRSTEARSVDLGTR